MFTPEELKNLQVLLARVNLTGNEALPVAQLQMKINQFLGIPTMPPAGAPVPETTPAPKENVKEGE